MVSTSTILAQHLSSAQAIARGAFTATADDLSALDWNPAALTSLKDWDLTTTNFITPTGSDHSFALHLIGLSKKIAFDHAIAFRISPGLATKFAIPSTFAFDRNAIQSSFISIYDKTIEYREPYAFGYAARIDRSISLGVSVHLLEETVTDARYSIDTNSVIRSSLVENAGTSWTATLGILWEPNRIWQAGVALENLFHLIEQPLAEQAAPYGLKLPKLMRVGVSFRATQNVSLNFDGDTQRQFRIGGEWSPMNVLRAEAGLYIDGSRSPKSRIDAIGVGIGWMTPSVQIDASYLAFTNRENRRGTVDLNTFQQTEIEAIEYNPFTSNRLTITARAVLGSTREPLARIEYVEILSDVFPASRLIYAYRPLGRARVRNLSGAPIDATVSFFVDRLMDAPTESKSSTIPAGRVAEIPFYAVFNDAIRSARTVVVHDGDVTVSARQRDDYDDRHQTRIVVHGRNDWNGDVTLLKYFVTPEDPDVIKFTRNALDEARSDIDSLPPSEQILERAKVIFDRLARRIVYVNDPKTSQDYVQYPAETIALRGGDCDDLSVCCAALLNSVGISVAFVDVVPPAKPEESHVYLMFDTGIEPQSASAISENAKRYVIRTNSNGRKSVWIPIEPTTLRGGFAGAWDTGAQEYYNDTEINMGLVNGWVRVVDFQSVY